MNKEKGNAPATERTGLDDLDPKERLGPATLHNN